MILKKWQKLSFAKQMGNIGSEFCRAKHWQENGDFENKQKALERAIEMIDLTISSQKKSSRIFEALRLREIFSDLFVNGGNYDISLKSLENYFLFFALIK